MIGEQLELLFDPPAPASGAVAAPAPVGGTSPPAKRRRAAGGAVSRESVPIPARCPVTGGRACYREGCHHYRPAGDGRCAHPVALVEAEPPARKPRRRRRR